MKNLTFGVTTLAVVALAAPAAAQSHDHGPAAPSRAHAHQAGTFPTSARGTVRQLSIELEVFKLKHGRYARSLEELEFTPGAGVELTAALSDGGYSIVARFAGTECAVYQGDARPARPYTTAPAAIRCDPPARDVRG